MMDNPVDPFIMTSMGGYSFDLLFEVFAQFTCASEALLALRACTCDVQAQ